MLQSNPIAAKTARKTGRKQIHFVTSEGETIVGLSRRPSDGRWRIIGTQTTFSEADERKAVERFRMLTGEDDRQRDEQLQRTMDQQTGFGPGGRGWRMVADLIRSRPQWCAEQLGIEQIAYLADLKRPEPPPTFEALSAIWKQHAKGTPDYRGKVLRAWKHFTERSGATGLPDITDKTVVAYQDLVHGEGHSPKQQLHIFSGIRRLLRFARGRAVAVDHINRSLAVLSILQPNDSAVSLNPQPIERADLAALLGKATGDERAMLLLMLNAALYAQEVIRVRWAEIDKGCLITHRMKKGKIVRVSVLWQETLDALAQVKRRGEFIFFGRLGLPLGITGAQRRFNELATAAKVPHVTASMLRDGAATAAAAANVNEKLCALLLGHRCGMSDHYVKRNPKMVAPATDAVYRHYFG